MLLTIDIGNTNLTLGLYEGDQLGAHWRLATDHNRMPDEYGLQFLGLLQNAGKTLDLFLCPLLGLPNPATSIITFGPAVIRSYSHTTKEKRNSF